MMQKKTYIKDKVTAVIPVYNEERFLRQCLESVVDQVDCVVLGDNASTDGTEAICREFAERYSYVEYFRNQRNLGSTSNFVLCHERVGTEYAFHIGGHDLIPEGYVDSLKYLFFQRPDAVCVFPDVYEFSSDLEDASLHPFPNMDQYLIASANSNPYHRAYHFFCHCVSWHPLYGLFRSDVYLPIVRTFQPIPDCDYAILFAAYMKGTFLYADGTKYLRRDIHGQRTDQDNHVEYMKRVLGDSLKTTEAVCDRRLMVEHVVQTYDACVCDEYLKSKAKYRDLLKSQLCRIYGIPTGNFILDMKVRMKHFAKNNPVSIGYKRCWKNNPWRKKISGAIKNIRRLVSNPVKHEEKYADE